MPEYWQSKRRLGDEGIALDQFERRAGRIGHILVVAGGDDARAVRGDADLRRAEHVARGMKRDLDGPELQLLAIRDRLCRAREVRPITQAHHVEGFLRRQHGAMAGARVIRMAVCDQRALDRPRGIDGEIADRAAQARRHGPENVFRTHDLQICHIGLIANPGTAGRCSSHRGTCSPTAATRWRAPMRPTAILRRRPTCTRRRWNSRPASRRRGSRLAKRARRWATGKRRAPRSSGPWPPTRTIATALHCALRGLAEPIRPRRRCTGTCARCSINTRRALTARWRTWATARRRYCARR